MATSNAIPLSDDERKIVVSSLELKRASLARAVKAASIRDVALAYEAEIIRVNALIGRFS